MKSFVDGIIAALLFIKPFIDRDRIVRHQYRFGKAIVLDALVVIIGFDVVVVAIQIVSGAHILPLDIILGASLLSLLFLSFSKMLPRADYASSAKEINVADLLERDVIALQPAEAHAVLKGRTILVTGAAGSIGSELCRQLLNYEPELIIALDNNETGLFDLAESLRSHSQAGSFYPYIGDITDMPRMSHLFTMKRPQIVFHAAAYKHVPLLEGFPDQAIRTNVLATYHLCRLAQECRVARFVFISTDKAVEPKGVMGASKRIGEMIIHSLARSADCETRFCAVRFGNVIGSRGSVVPVFAQQIAQGGPITVTDPDATRYFMTIPEACGLVILTAAMADQGGLYLLDMGKPVRIMDLAIKMTRLHGLRMGRDIPVIYTGLRPGEHLHETLVATNEELIPTAHDKIFRIAHRDNLPTLTTIAQLMQALEGSLQGESHEQLRVHLFKIVRQKELMIVH